MYFYCEIGAEGEIKAEMNLPRRPRPDEIKSVNGLPVLRPIVTEPLPDASTGGIYEVGSPEMVVEPTRVVRRFKTKLRPDYKDILKRQIIAAGHTARSNAMGQLVLAATGLQVAMMKDEEAEEFLDAKEEDRTREKFPLVFACVGSVADTTEGVALAFRADFLELKTRIADIEGEQSRLIKAIDDAKTAEAAVRAFDSRMEIFKR